MKISSDGIYWRVPNDDCLNVPRIFTIFSIRFAKTIDNFRVFFLF